MGHDGYNTMRLGKRGERTAGKNTLCCTGVDVIFIDTNGLFFFTDVVVKVVVVEVVVVVVVVVVVAVVEVVNVRSFIPRLRFIYVLFIYFTGD